MKIGITSTIPVEVVYAAGHIPVDLNNVLIQNENIEEKLLSASMYGFPETCCSWIKGIFSVAKERTDIEAIIAVVGGDCSNTNALMEVLQVENKKLIPFSYPHEPVYEDIKIEIEKLIKNLGTNWDEVYRFKKRLDKIRKKVQQIDELTYEENKVTSFENHYWQVSCSDFLGDPGEFEIQIDKFIEEVKTRKPELNKLRLGYLGVPPFVQNLYDEIERIGGRIVFNEIQRQFAMPSFEEDIVAQYQKYTYPYSIFDRIKDIQEQIEARNIKGLIHYTQTFCHRAIQDIVIKKQLNLPILRIESNDNNLVDSKLRTQLEAFIEMIKT